MTEQLKYLYDRLLLEFGRRYLEQIAVPACIRDALNPAFELRPYQVEAFQRFLCYYENEFAFKERPTHLLYNMATGSGKTLIMAGLIAYLYAQGHRHFIFFVNSTNIIEKTRANFLDPTSGKYLFAPALHIGDRPVRITPVDNFSGAHPDDISICFTTIQGLHSQLTSERENALTFEDLGRGKVVLIADEAHHLNVSTKKQAQQALEGQLPTWENTVERVFRESDANLLLEFTATHDYTNPAMADKYCNKVIFRYDLVQFRNDRFSKDLVIVQSDFEQRERMLQALILSQYKQEVAAANRIACKPVILFKAQRTIAQSVAVQADFRRLIDGLDAAQVAAVRERTGVKLVQRAFRFFAERGISDQQLAERLRREFQPEYCLSVNEEQEKERYQLLVNSLEERDNHVRAIFAVQKLNEGWDVLNLFDIVRCYEARDTGRAKTGRTTMAEAQLIGRGARYFPFVVTDGVHEGPGYGTAGGPDKAERFRRKFDSDLTHDLRVLEELHYHSINDSRYIAEIRAALVEQGMLDEHEVTRPLRLKESFKQTELWKYGIIWLNRKRAKDYAGVHSFADLGVSRRNYQHRIATGGGGETVALDASQPQGVVRDTTRKDLAVGDIPTNVVQGAIARLPFYTFASLRRYFPNLTGIREFIHSEQYLGGLSITFEGKVYAVQENRRELLNAMLGLLATIEAEVRAQVTEYEGTREFHREWVREVFTDKLLKIDVRTQRGQEDVDFEAFVSSKDWFATNTLYGTSEEKYFVHMLQRQMAELEKLYEQIYLLRNEGHFAIYSFRDGQAFQPDFVLFLRDKGGALHTYQLFIEPKGKHLQEAERWKLDFLNQIRAVSGESTLVFQDKEFRLIGVPFYNVEDENAFKQSLEAALRNTQA